MKALLAIPTYNCADQIVRVLPKVGKFREQFPNFDLLVVDNNSDDETVESSIQFLGSQGNWTHFANAENTGLGGSQKAIFTYAISENYDWVVVLHGDDQAEIQDLFPVVSRLSQDQVDAYLGSRFESGSRLEGYSKRREWANRFFNFLFSLRYRKKITDLGSGLNVFNVHFLRSLEGWEKAADDLTFNYDLLACMCRAKAKLVFFPISWAETDQTSNVRALRQFLQLLWIALKPHNQRRTNKRHSSDQQLDTMNRTVTRSRDVLDS